MDMCLGELFALLEEKNLLENTIVVIAGDHGEEYYEKGHLGHSSVFNEEQTRTPLIIYYPGVKPQRYAGLSSHLDIIPMLAGFFGVKNDPADYSCGINLLAPDAPKRRYAIIANWDQVFFAGEKYKSLIPLDTASFAAQTITDVNDNELPEVDPFYEEYNADLIKVQEDLNRFTAPPDNEQSSTVLWVIAGTLLIAGAAAAGIIIHRKRKSKTAQC
jgi:membrane-anchored protein YejM (alkaline phosphatase superfamily)